MSEIQPIEKQAYLTVARVFTIPFLGDLVGRIRNRIKFRDELWI